MTITKEQKELLNMIMDNKENLEQLLRIASMKQIQAKDLQIGQSVKMAGILWSKFAEDENGNAYMLADDIIGTEKFGECNDWRISPIRTKTMQELRKKITEELGTNALVEFETDLFSHDGLDTYGTCKDYVALPTYDLYRKNRRNIKIIDKPYLLSTPDSTNEGCSSVYVRYVSSDGLVHCHGFDWSGGVRPFCIINLSIFLPIE